MRRVILSALKEKLQSSESRRRLSVRAEVSDVIDVEVSAAEDSRRDVAQAVRRRADRPMMVRVEDVE